MIHYNIKENSTHTWFYKWVTSSHKLPESMCKFFWTVVLGWVSTIPTAPLLIPLLFSKEFRKDPTKIFPMGMILIELLLTAVIVIIAGAFNTTWDEFATGCIHFAIVITICAIFFLIAYGIVASIRKIKDYLHDRKLNRMSDEQRRKYWKDEVARAKKRRQPGFIRAGFDAFMNKHCPKINWVKEK